MGRYRFRTVDDVVQYWLFVRSDAVLSTLAQVDRRRYTKNGPRGLRKSLDCLRCPTAHVLRVQQRPIPSSTQKTSLQSRRNLLTLLKSFLFRTPSFILDSLKILLPLSIFFVKFLEWWYSPTSPARVLHSKADNGPLLPQPKVLKPHSNGILGAHPHEIYARKRKQEGLDGTPPLKYGICPLCDGPLANATALPSGYVFCYKCVFEEVEKHGRCPVTLLPMRTWMLRKVLV